MSLKVEEWPIDRLVPYARNPRKNDAVVAKMISAIREFGFRIPIVAKSDGSIVEGKEWEWQLFKSYHYLSGDHNSAARKFVAEIEGTPVAWCSVLHMPNRQKNMKRVHRLVVRPDFQGIGIGKALLAFVSDFFTAQGYRITITSSLGTFCKALCHDSRWSMTRHGYAAKYSGMGNMKKHCSHNRLTASFEYVG